MAHESHTKTLPADLSAPPVVNTWRTRALIVGVVFSVIAAGLAFADGSIDHVLRAWLLGLVLTFGFAVGGLALLMVQYVTGGKWGLLLRRPLEAMSRTLPLVFVYWIPIAVFQGKLYMWANHGIVDQALKLGQITQDQVEAIDHAIKWKAPMLNPTSFVVVSVICFAIWGFYTWRLNSLALKRDADSPDNTPFWIKKFENLSGFGILVYSLTMTAVVIYWVMSLDVTWYSSVYGLLFLVGQGYQVLAFAILISIALSQYEPFKTVLRQTEQHDLGKFTFAFVMLNIYLGFAQFLIIWSGNLPEEIPWYLDRIRGHWGIIITLDFIFHWLIPFSLLLSRDIKRNKKRLTRICQWMIFAKAFDLFWLIEPNFKDAARNLHFSWGILEYIAVPVALTAFWFAFFTTRLQTRGLVAINDPHVVEILEPEHAHA
ncbi:hypothetical protein [Terracidiphilus gabretensis]|uniref:hypothetical protein n=1 Tax=Terracidiphilus gabretensis TaxID=1577687 RepID=UPI00071C1C2F|nr:hypothetical protein [Terracidiphilus gabretensis]